MPISLQITPTWFVAQESVMGRLSWWRVFDFVAVVAGQIFMFSIFPGPMFITLTYRIRWAFASRFAATSYIRMFNSHLFKTNKVLQSFKKKIYAQPAMQREHCHILLLMLPLCIQCTDKNIISRLYTRWVNNMQKPALSEMAWALACEEERTALECQEIYPWDKLTSAEPQQSYFPDTQHWTSVLALQVKHHKEGQTTKQTNKTPRIIVWYQNGKDFGAA